MVASGVMKIESNKPKCSEAYSAHAGSKSANVLAFGVSVMIAFTTSNLRHRKVCLCFMAQYL